ncbi:MAG: hypothetical protein QXS74_08935 [Nitrososphaeria archaeon]
MIIRRMLSFLGPVLGEYFLETVLRLLLFQEIMILELIALLEK